MNPYLHGYENVGDEFFFISVSVTDHDWGTDRSYHMSFPSHSSLFIVSPRNIIISGNDVYATISNGNIVPYNSSMPFIVGCSPGLSDGVITDQMTLVLENNTEYTATRNNDQWSYGIFENNTLLNAVLDEMGAFEDGKSYCVILRLKNTYGIPHKTFFLPFIYVDDINAE